MIRVSTPYDQQVCDITYWHAPSDNHNNLPDDMAGAMCILSLVIEIAKIDGTDATLQSVYMALFEKKGVTNKTWSVLQLCAMACISMSSDLGLVIRYSYLAELTIWYSPQIDCIRKLISAHRILFSFLLSLP